jgi:hypothetical protein
MRRTDLTAATLPWRHERTDPTGTVLEIAEHDGRIYRRRINPNGSWSWLGPSLEHVPSPGRPPNVLRGLAAETFVRALPALERIIDGEPVTHHRRVRNADGTTELLEYEAPASVRDRIAALKMLAWLAKPSPSEVNNARRAQRPKSASK